MGAELIAICDQMWVYGDRASEGMRRDIVLAQERGIPVIQQN